MPEFALIRPEMAASKTLFDESKFFERLSLQALRVPKHLCGDVSKVLTGCVLKKPRLKHITVDPANPELRLILLSETVKSASLDEIPEEKRDKVKKLVDMDIVSHELLLGYEHWPADHVLRKILPPEIEVPSSFETIGHIAHLNLRDEHMPYKDIIGKVILDKNTKIKTVVNKVGTIENEFRVPEFELLAGEKNMIAEVKQCGAVFQLDYGLVYWNSRLEHEHNRLVEQFQPGEVISDMFAGIGPFAIPAAQKGCLVFANDLNPASVTYLTKNAKSNKVEKRVATYNMDARDFLRRLMDPSMKQEPKQAEGAKNKQSSETTKNRGKRPGPNNQSFRDISEAKPWEHFDHVVMNLPALALTFLDVFNGLLSRSYWKGSMPRIHCYCFMSSKQTEDDIVGIAESYLGGSLAERSIWTVRSVAPNKTMLCLSFVLPEAIAFGEKDKSTSDSGTEAASPKRPRTL